MRTEDQLARDRKETDSVCRFAVKIASRLRGRGEIREGRQRQNLRVKKGKRRVGAGRMRSPTRDFPSRPLLAGR